MFDAVCKTKFGKDNVYTQKDNKNLLIGKLDTQTDLWRNPLEDGKIFIPNMKHYPRAQCNAVWKSTNLRDLLAYLHDAYLSPYVTILIDVVQKGYFSG